MGKYLTGSVIHFWVICIMSSVAIGATFVVNDPALYGDNNQGNGICDTFVAGDHCTLQAAIDEANANPGPDTITFSQPFSYSVGAMPAIVVTDPYLTIDASSQWNQANDRPGVELQCGPGFTPAITLAAGASHVEIKGLMFSAYCTAISIESGYGHIIGGSGAGERNVFMTTTEPAIFLSYADGPAGSVAATIKYNYFGTINGEAYLDSHTYLGETAIQLQRQLADEYSEIVIENNVIGEQRKAIEATYTEHIVIKNNKIGSFGTTAIPNLIGIYITDGSEATVTGNIISNSTQSQILHSSYFSQSIYSNNTVTGGNYASSPVNGADIQGYALLSNNIFQNHAGNGLHITTKAEIDNNTIYLNAKDGIKISAYPGSLIKHNSIIWNGQNGINIYSGTGLVVKSNLIGVTAINANGGNGLNGILISGTSIGNSIGSSVAGEENYICWNAANGIKVEGSGTHDNQIGGNVIGSTPKKDNNYIQAPNGQHGIALYSLTEHNKIGQLGAIFTPNYIFASSWSGIAVVNSNYNEIVFNRIGTDEGSRNWGNKYWGVHVGGNNNLVWANVIANNGKAATPQRSGIGVDGAGAWGNQLKRNILYDNGGKGIELMNGGNQGISPPILQRQNMTLSGTTYPFATVEFFSGSDKDEGRYYEGEVQADGSGNYSWQKIGNFHGKHVTATTTISPYLSTSEFSLPVKGYEFPWPLFLQYKKGNG